MRWQLILAVCVLTLCRCSPPPNPEGWAVSFAAPGRATVQDLALNPAGDVFVTGLAGKVKAYWGEVFVAKVSSAGHLRWLTGLGGSTSYGSHVAVTADGAIYVAIERAGTDYGRKTTVLKLSPRGDVIWSREFESLDYVVLRGLATDRTGQLYVTGFFSGTTTFGALTRAAKSVAPGTSDLFVARLDAQGKTLQVVTAQGLFWASSSGLALGRGGEVYVAGACPRGLGGARFGAATWAGKHAAVFVTKIEASGKFAWTRFFESSVGVGAGGVTVDDAGEVFVAGGYLGNISIGEQTIRTTAVEALAQEHAFWVNLSASGKIKSYGVGGGQHRVSIIGVAVGAGGDRFMAGGFDVRTQFGVASRESRGESDVLVVGVDGGGKVRGVATGGGPGADGANAIAADGRGGCYVGGEFEGTAEFGTMSLDVVGLSSGFVWKFECDGIVSQ